jgi:hypothetical protein
MNKKRFVTVAPLGFIGWAGVSAWRQSGRTKRKAAFSPGST